MTYDPPAPRGAAATGEYDSERDTSRSRVAAAILAAGRGSRFGGDARKCVAEWRGRPLVAWAQQAPLDAGLSPVLLVTGHGRRVVDPLAAPGIDVVHSPRWHEGIAHSLRAALDALEGYASVEAGGLGLADQPRVGADGHRR